uniref:Yippee domain-containing protein n=1 Tax=Sus scrofa TaxID=9823 RepID=A0A8D1HAV0_PIG
SPACGACPTPTPCQTTTFQAYLPSCHRTYSCIHCRAHLANHDELISKVPSGSWVCRCSQTLPKGLGHLSSHFWSGEGGLTLMAVSLN